MLDNSQEIGAARIRLDLSGVLANEHKEVAGARADYELNHDPEMRATRARIEESNRRPMATPPRFYEGSRFMIPLAIANFALFIRRSWLY